MHSGKNGRGSRVRSMRKADRRGAAIDPDLQTGWSDVSGRDRYGASWHPSSWLWSWDRCARLRTGRDGRHSTMARGYSLWGLQRQVLPFAGHPRLRHRPQRSVRRLSAKAFRAQIKRSDTMPIAPTRRRELQAEPPPLTLMPAPSPPALLTDHGEPAGRPARFPRPALAKPRPDHRETGCRIRQRLDGLDRFVESSSHQKLKLPSSTSLPRRNCVLCPRTPRHA